jgi:hypothetical protein
MTKKQTTLIPKKRKRSRSRSNNSKLKTKKNLRKPLTSPNPNSRTRTMTTVRRSARKASAELEFSNYGVKGKNEPKHTKKAFSRKPIITKRTRLTSSAQSSGKRRGIKK